MSRKVALNGGTAGEAIEEFFGAAAIVEGAVVVYISGRCGGV